jgi:nitrite reductase/ring-hydroxylating ferredoxin subunit
VILFAMAATSHDFWLRTLTAPVWKALHMGVYVAYASLVVHVMFGVVQSEVPTTIGVGVGAGVAWIAALHTLTASREARRDRTDRLRANALVDVCHVDDIPDRRARIACLNGERVAVFRYEGKISAVSNVCQHQNGPLGDGKIVGGCIVCPWHGFEYHPDTGAAPPPFTEAVPTFRVQVRDGRVLVDPRPLAPGTRVQPAMIGSKGTKDTKDTKGTKGAKVESAS